MLKQGRNTQRKASCIIQSGLTHGSEVTQFHPNHIMEIKRHQKQFTLQYSIPILIISPQYGAKKNS